MVNDLRTQVRRKKNQTRRSTDAEKQAIFQDIEEKLHGLDLEGTVSTILVYDARGQINCYGERITPENIFRALNLTIGTQGTKLTGKITYPEMHRMKPITEGYFVPFRNREGEYATLVNIPVDTADPEVLAYHFPKSRLR